MQSELLSFLVWICPLCGESLSDVAFVKDSEKYFASQGIKHWIEEGLRGSDHQ